MNCAQCKFIFHIEDDDDDSFMLKEAVQKIDPAIEVWSAKNGQEGLEVLVQFSLLQTLPALIILDLNLPGMDGKKVLMELKQHDALSAVPVVIFTTSSSELDKHFALKQGISIVTKPTSETLFLEAVKNILQTSFKISSGGSALN